MSITFRNMQVGDIGWLVWRHAIVYSKEFGWDQSFEIAAARQISHFSENCDPQKERAWIAERDDKFLGCIFICHNTNEEARLRMLLVEPDARGLGLGNQLINLVIAFARNRGYRRLMLWTCSQLSGARRLYTRAGFKKKSEEPQTRFGVEMIGEFWELTL